MAYIIDQKVTPYGTAATSANGLLPTHATGDLLIAVVGKYGNGTLALNGGSSSWTQLCNQVNSTSIRGGVFYKIATSGSETAPQFDSSTSTTWHIMTLSIRDFDAGAPFDVYSETNAAASSWPTQTGVTTNYNNSLVIYANCFNSAANANTAQYMPKQDLCTLTVSDNGAGSGVGISSVYKVQSTAGATGSIDWYSSGSLNTSARFVLAIKNAAGGIIGPHLDNNYEIGELIHPFTYNTNMNGTNFNAALDITTFAGRSAAIKTTTMVIDSGITPYASVVNCAPTSTPATNLQGWEMSSMGMDISVGTIVCAASGANAQSGMLTLGTVQDGGMMFALADGSNNYRCYQVFASDASPKPFGRNIFVVQQQQTDTAIDVSGTPNLGITTKFFFLYNNPSSGVSMNTSEMHLIKNFVIAGGASLRPLNLLDLEMLGNSLRVPIIQKSGSAALLIHLPVQVGGADPIYTKFSNATIQFPRTYDTENKEINVHTQAKFLGFLFKTQSGDTVSWTNSTISSPSEYKFEFDAAAAGTFDFTGTSIIGAYVTLKPVTTFSQMKFVDCTQISALGTTISGCSISGVPTANDKFLSDGSTSVTGSTIDVSKVTAGNRFCSVASPSIFTNCTFKGGGGHAIRITTPGTYTLSGNTFNSFGADGSTGAAILNDSGGSVTLNISGGTTPTVKNGAGASTTVNNALPVTLDNIIVGSRYYIMKNSDSSEIASGVAATSTVELSSTVTGAVTVRVRKAGYIPFETGGTIGASGMSTWVSQVADPVYQ